jgi:hypothetical protein
MPVPWNDDRGNLIRLASTSSSKGALCDPHCPCPRGALPGRDPTALAGTTGSLSNPSFLGKDHRGDAPEWDSFSRTNFRGLPSWAANSMVAVISGSGARYAGGHIGKWGLGAEGVCATEMSTWNGTWDGRKPGRLVECQKRESMHRDSVSTENCCGRPRTVKIP